MKKKIKLRDMTRKQRDELCTKFSVCSSCPFDGDKHGFRGCISRAVNEVLPDKFLNQEIEIEAPDILTPEEKEYLEAVIKPFRSWVKSIGKIHCELDDERLVIAINHYPAITIPTTNYLRFEGITQDDSFTLEELGL